MTGRVPFFDVRYDELSLFVVPIILLVLSSILSLTKHTIKYIYYPIAPIVMMGIVFWNDSNASNRAGTIPTSIIAVPILSSISVILTVYSIMMLNVTPN